LSGKMTRQRVAALPDDDWRKKNLNFQEPQLSRQLAVAERLREIAAGLRHGGDRPFTVAELALAWVLHQRGVTGAIVGARTPEQVDDFLRADQILLDAATLEKIGRLTAAG
jgi:aryl-alcohol dehydrogenase-like predicted oxidoreductase